LKALWAFLRVCPVCQGGGLEHLETTKMNAILRGIPAKFHNRIKGSRNVRLSTLCRSCKGKGRSTWRMMAGKLRLLATVIVARYWAKVPA